MARHMEYVCGHGLCPSNNRFLGGGDFLGIMAQIPVKNSHLVGIPGCAATSWSESASLKSDNDLITHIERPLAEGRSIQIVGLINVDGRPCWGSYLTERCALFCEKRFGGLADEAGTFAR